MRKEYDYILIDSRSGFSDTAGICTVQMPDYLILLFTANYQSIYGAANVAASILGQRRAGFGGTGTGLRIFPVLARTDGSEGELLDRIRATVRALFDPLLDHLATDEHDRYFGQVEIPYIPWYSYVESLATFCDDPGQSRSMLATMEHLTGYISNGEVRKLIPPPPASRAVVLAKYSSLAGLSPAILDVGSQ